MRKQGLWKTGLAWAGLCAVFLLTRTMLALPWVLLRDRRETVAVIVLRCFATLLVWLFAVLPEHGFHCWAAMRLSRQKTQSYSYFNALKVSLYRVFRVSYAVIPAAGLAVFLYYLLYGSTGSLMPLNTFKNIGILFTSQRRFSYDVGLAVLLGVLALFVILFLICWYPHTPNDYLQSIRPFRRTRFDGRAMCGFLMAVPAYALWMLVFCLFMAPRLSEYSGLMNKALKLTDVLSLTFSQRAFRVEMALILVLVYCPFWCLRKRSGARAAARMAEAEHAA